jgi:hypothetical protein
MLIRQNNDSLTFEEAIELLPKEFAELDPQMELEFSIEGEKLFLHFENTNPFSIDIQKKWDYHQRHFYKTSLYKDPLAKALGVKKGGPKPLVADATGGSLSDAILIRSYGCHVEAYERNPLVRALIINALKFAPTEFLEGFKLAGKSITQNYEVIYFDPMYSEKNEKAAPKKRDANF